MSASNVQKEKNHRAHPMPDDKMKEAMELFAVPTTANNEISIALFIAKRLEEMNVEYIVDDYGNIMVTKGVGPYPCFSAHLDTVHMSYQNGFNIIKEKVKDHTYLYAMNDKKLRVGIGGDDKCGIFVCLQLLQTVENIKVVFFSQEEAGGIGSSNMDKQFFADCRFIGEVDRWNGKDFVSQYSGTQTISDEFKKDIKAILKKFGYAHASGLFTDVFNIIDKTKLSSFNISCGYYQHHSNNEYVDLNELWNSYLICKELAGLSKVYPHTYSLYDWRKYEEYDYEGGARFSWRRDDKYGWVRKTRQYDPKLDAKRADGRTCSEGEDIKVCKWCGLELFEWELKYYKGYCSSCYNDHMADIEDYPY